MRAQLERVGLSIEAVSLALNEAMLRRGVSPKGLARLVNKPIATVASWLQGKTCPRIEVVYDLCELLRFTTDQFFQMVANHQKRIDDAKHGPESA